MSSLLFILTMFLTSLYSSVSSPEPIFPYFVAFLGPVKLHDDSYTAVKLYFTEAFSLHLNGEGTDQSFNHLKTVLKVCHRQRERTQLKNTLRQVNKLNNSRQWRNLESIARKQFCLILSSKTSHERLPRKWFKMLRTRTPSELPRARNQILPLSIC